MPSSMIANDGSPRTTVFRSASVFIMVTALQSIAGIAILPILIRRLDEAKLGELVTAQLVSLVVTLIVSLGLTSAVSREFFDTDGPIRARRVFGILSVIVPVLTGLVHLAGPLWVRVFDSLGYGSALTIAVWSAWPRVIVLAGLALFRARLAVRPFAAFATVSAVGSQIGGLLVLGQGSDVARYLAGAGVVQAVLAIMITVLVKPVFSRFLSTARSSLRYSVPVIFHSVAGLLISMGDRLLIERELGLDAVGRYQVAYVVGSLGVVLFLAINNAWAPLVLGSPEPARRPTLVWTTQSLVRLAASVTVSLAAAVPLGLAVLAPASYGLEQLTRTAMIITVIAVPMVLYLSGNHLAMIDRRTLRVAVSTASAAALNVGANLVLIPVAGLDGAAIATVLSYVVWAAATRAGSDARRVDWGLGAAAPTLGAASLALVLLFLAPAGAAGIALRFALGAGAAVLALHQLAQLKAALSGAEQLALIERHTGDASL